MKVRETELTEIDRQIIKYIKENDKKIYKEIIQNDPRLEIFLALSNIRENIINWYPFENNSTILEIGTNYGEITEILCENAKKVVSYEIQKEKIEAVKKKLKNKKNLKIVDSIDNIEEKFDYVTIIGIETITDYIKEMLIYAKKFLKENGKILVATNNKLGLKNNITYFGEHCETLYNYDEWNQILDSIGFTNRKFYYPMTDYKLANAIFTDKRIMGIDDISRNIIYNDENTIKFRDENNLYIEMIKNGVDFRIISNAFFIEIFNGRYVENDIRLIYFSNMRKDKYKIKTIMKNDFVSKYSYNNEGIKHIDNIKKNIDIMNKCNLKTLDFYNENHIISKCVEADTLDVIIIKKIKNDKEKAISLIKKFKKELFDKLEKCGKNNNVFDKYNIEYDESLLEDMQFTNYGLWDLIFQNCFYINEEFYFYDQEWIEEKLPINFILYRAIKYFNEIKNYLSECEIYKILEIDTKQIELFEKLDNKLQEDIRSNLIWQFQKQGKTIRDVKIEKLTDNHRINLLNIEINEKNREIENKNKEMNDKELEIISLKEQNKGLQNEINSIKNSKSWKLTEPIRKLKGQWHN